jgi:hypothetical protein
LPPVGQLDGDDVLASDAELDQAVGDPIVVSGQIGLDYRGYVLR